MNYCEKDFSNDIAMHYFKQNVLPFYVPDYKRISIIERYGILPDRKQSIIPSREYQKRLINDVNYGLTTSKSETNLLYTYAPERIPRVFKRLKRCTRGMAPDYLWQRSPDVFLQPL